MRLCVKIARVGLLVLALVGPSSAVAAEKPVASITAGTSGAFSYPMPLDPQQLDWSVRHDYRFDSLILFNIMEGLVEIGRDGQPIPALAERWEASPDGLTYTFFLRPGIKWTDGAPLKAKDFVYGWRRVLEPATKSGYEFYLYDMKNAEAFHDGRIKDFSKVGVRALDDRRLEVKLEARDPYFVNKLYFYIAFPQREDVVGRKGYVFNPLKLVTLGPYRITAWEKGHSLTLTANPTYYGEAPTLPTVQAVIEPSGAKVDALVASGKLDILLRPSTEQIVRHTVDSKTPLTLKQYDSLNIIYLGFNTKRAPISNIAFRHAVAMALDRGAIARRIANGMVAAEGLLPKSLAEFAPEALPLDLEEARHELVTAGYKDRESLPDLKLVYEAPDREPLAKLVSEVLSAGLGLHVEPVGVSLAELTRSMRSGRYDLFLASWVADFYGPATFFDMMRPDSGFNLTGWKSKQYDDLVKQAESSASALKRADFYTAAQDLLFRTDTAIAPILHQKISVLVGDRVARFELFPTLPYFYFKHTAIKR